MSIKFFQNWESVSDKIKLIEYLNLYVYINFYLLDSIPQKKHKTIKTLGQDFRNLKRLLCSIGTSRWWRRSRITISRHWTKRCWSKQNELLGFYMFNKWMGWTSNCNSHSNKNFKKNKVFVYRWLEKIYFN